MTTNNLIYPKSYIYRQIYMYMEEIEKVYVMNNLISFVKKLDMPSDKFHQDWFKYFNIIDSTQYIKTIEQLDPEVQAKFELDLEESIIYEIELTENFATSLIGKLDDFDIHTYLKQTNIDIL